jgi:hypothetical protein
VVVVREQGGEVAQKLRQGVRVPRERAQVREERVGVAVDGEPGEQPGNGLALRIGVVVVPLACAVVEAAPVRVQQDRQQPGRLFAEACDPGLLRRR